MDLEVSKSSTVRARWAGADAPESAVELPGFDLNALRSALTAPSRRIVQVRHRTGLLAHRNACAIREIDPGFTFDYRGPIDALPASLKKALRSAGLASNKVWEALQAEILYLFRVFASLAEDPEPVVHLAAEEASLPFASSSSRLALFAILAQPDEDAARDVAVVARAPCAEDLLLLPLGGSARRLTLYLASEHEPVSSDAGSPAAGEVADVALVSVPFGIVGQPSLGLSLLKQTLPPGAATVLYLTLPLARQIGLFTYNWIAELQPFFTALLGEWIFSGALTEEAPGDAQRYLDEILLPPTARWFADVSENPSFLSLVPEGVVKDVLRIRSMAGDYLDACADRILECRPRIVGLTSVFQQQAAALALACRLKERDPGVSIVMGGSNCEGTLGLATVRRFAAVDAVVSGEGEVVFPQIVARLLAGEPLEGLPGVYTRTSSATVDRRAEPPNAPSPRHMDDLPLPDFDDFFGQYRESGLSRLLQPKLLLETSRGCWWGAKQHCTFCGLNGSGMAFRSKTPERALAEIRAFTHRYPGLFLDMADLILDMRYFGTLLPRLAEEGLRLRMFYEVKANLKKEQVRQLRAAGVIAIQPGIESLSDEVLRIMRKGVTALQNLQLLKWCAEFGVQPYWNMIWGFPGEPPEEYGRMAELLPLLHHLPPPASMSTIFLERFSPNFFQSEELGFADVRPASSYSHLYPMASADLTDLAYFFEYRYQDGRTIAAYTRPLMRRIVEWQEAHSRSRLTFFDQGDRLLLFDSRATAARPLAVVEGLSRKLYLACDSIQSIDHLCRLAAAEQGADQPERVEEILQPLIGSGYLVRQGNFVLALAIPGKLDGRASPDEVPQGGA